MQIRFLIRPPPTKHGPLHRASHPSQRLYIPLEFERIPLKEDQISSISNTDLGTVVGRRCRPCLEEGDALLRMPRGRVFLACFCTTDSGGDGIPLQQKDWGNSKRD